MTRLGTLSKKTFRAVLVGRQSRRRMEVRGADLVECIHVVENFLRGFTIHIGRVLELQG